MDYKEIVCERCNLVCKPSSGYQKLCTICAKANKKEINARYRERHRERLSERSREWYKNNKERSYAIKKKWRDNNKGHDNRLNRDLYWTHIDKKREEGRVRARENRKLRTREQRDVDNARVRGRYKED